MRLKCNDKVVRDFSVPEYQWKYDNMSIPMCLECGKEFPCYETFYLKPLFKQHVCNSEEAIEE